MNPESIKVSPKAPRNEYFLPHIKEVSKSKILPFLNTIGDFKSHVPNFKLESQK